jgi:hypothetical protein
MSKHPITLLLTSTVLITLLLLAGCGAVSRGSIEKDPSTVSLRTGDRQVFSVTVTECGRI